LQEGPFSLTEKLGPVWWLSLRIPQVRKEARLSTGSYAFRITKWRRAGRLTLSAAAFDMEALHTQVFIGK